MSLPYDWRAEFDRRGPWVTRFEIGGEVVGGDYDAAGDVRIRQFAEAFPGAQYVLELGALEGGHGFALAALPGVHRVVSLEGRLANLERALFVRDLLGRHDVGFHLVDLQDAALKRWGHFDACFAVGILYHLPRPWELLRELACITPRLFVWTHCAETAGVVAGGYRGQWYEEHGLADPLSGLSQRSFWPTRAELLRMLADCGFPDVAVIDEGRRNNAACITLTARARP